MQKGTQITKLLLIAVLTLSSHSIVSGQENGTIKSPIKHSGGKDNDKRKSIKLPGLVVDFKNHCVDIEATVCLEKGFLELVACTKGSKEHESMVAVSARPMHIHTALLLLGTKNGNPAIRKKIGKDEDRRWVDLPPRGDPISVAFVIQDNDQKPLERPISEFVVFSKDAFESKNRDVENRLIRKQSTDSKTFPRAFLFAGSQLQDTGKGPRQYLAEKSGNVISIVTFGDELLCLPEVQSHENGSLQWRIKPNQLPKVGTKILLRLRPSRKPVGEKDKNSHQDSETQSK